MAQHPGVREVAAVVMPAEHEGVENEVMLAIVPATSAPSIDEIVAYADSALPRFAKPRFVRLVDSLPKTPTERVQKALLRQQGIVAGTWDRQKQSTGSPGSRATSSSSTARVRRECRWGLWPRSRWR